MGIIMLVSIVTVCYNAEKVIAKTIRSVLKQTYTDIEYIVKDGVSKDSTNKIVCKYEERFRQKNIHFVHSVKKDYGIYDAMNQATALASGDYIIYMNAGDIFWDGRVLERIFDTEDNITADLLYGDCVCEYELMRGKKEYTLWRGQQKSFAAMPFSHQACFFRTELIRQCPYDLRFRSAADFHLISRLHMEGRRFKYTKSIIAICTMDGVSNTNIKTSYRDTIQIKRELGMKEELADDTVFSLWFMGVKERILKIFPYNIAGALLRVQLRRQGKRIYSNLWEISQRN